jgi:hypothetical protein
MVSKNGLITVGAKHRDRQQRMAKAGKHERTAYGQWELREKQETHMSGLYPGSIR